MTENMTDISREKDDARKRKGAEHTRDTFQELVP